MMEEKTNCANLFTLDFSCLTKTLAESAFAACKTLFARPSNCIRGENSTVRAVLIATHKIDGDLFAYHLRKTLQSYIPADLLDKILVTPKGVVWTQKEISAFWRYT